MTTPRLPNGMRPEASPYGADDPGGAMRTEVAGGMARYALDWDRGPQRYTINLMFNPIEFSVWTAFYRHIIKKGSIAFNMPLDSGFGPSQHLVNIMPGSYSETRTGGVSTVVAFVVEAENQAYDMTATDAQSMIDLYNTYGDVTDALLARIAQFATVDTLVLAP